MKPVLRFSVALATVALLGLVLSACEGDRGPAGPAGTTECMTCHSDDFNMANFLLPIQTQYAVSQHANGETFVRTGSSCTRCHTNEGYQNYIATGEGGEVANSSQIGCFTCHAPHSNRDFTLRQMGAVALMEGGTFDRGNANTCANCHQAREASPPIADDTEASGRWGTHHGPQANVLLGMGAYEFDGAYATGPSHATIPNACVNCHMADPPEGGVAGGHSWWMTYEFHGAEELNSHGCVACHDTWDDEIALEEVDDFKAAFLADLQTLMVAMGPNGQGWFTSEDLADAGGSILKKQIYSADQLGAVWNFRMLAEDRSGGVHNTVFARAVLDATLDYVNSLP